MHNLVHSSPLGALPPYIHDLKKGNKLENYIHCDDNNKALILKTIIFNDKHYL